MPNRLHLVALLLVSATACGSSESTESAGDTTADEATDDAADSTTEVAPDTTNATRITYAGTTVTVSGSGVETDGAVATVTSGGTYIVDGQSSAGQLVVNTADAEVTLSLEGLTLDAGADMAVYVASAGAVHLYAIEDSINTFANASGADVEAAIYAESPLSIAGPGQIAVSAESGGGIVTEGDFTLDDVALDVLSADSALKSNANLTIEGGSFTLTAGNDGVHADLALNIHGGDITVTRSEEGIEGANITITGGTVHVTSTDDGVNGSTDDDSDAELHMSGGYVYVNAEGDGIDVNGSITMTGGTFVVDGPTGNDNGALDYDDTFVVSGGTIIAAGSAGMSQTPSSSSSQRSVKFTFSSAQPAGQLLHLETSDGTALLTYAPAKTYRTLVFSSAQLSTGVTYSIYTGGSSSGILTDGIYSGGTFTGGNERAAFVIQGINTNVTVN